VPRFLERVRGGVFSGISLETKSAKYCRKRIGTEYESLPPAIKSRFKFLRNSKGSGPHEISFGIQNILVFPRAIEAAMSANTNIRRSY
jgi:hypothetical protein